jgi:CBS domain-containing protein
MNIAFFLTPKRDIVYVTVDATMKEVLERMELSTYTSIPLIDNEGKYVGAITEGDLLWKLKNTPGLNIEDTEDISITDVQRHTKSHTVSIGSNIEDLITLSKSQNFVPVVDDEGIFIGRWL